MKKIIIVFSIFLSLTACNETKVVYVDVEEVLKEYKGSKVAEEEMKLQSSKISGELDQLAQVFQQKVQEYKKSMNTLSSKARAEQEGALMQEQQMLQQRQQMAQQQVQAEGLKKVDEINEEIENFIAKHAKTKRYTYVLGTTMQTKNVLYGEESLDITEEVITGLNESYKGDTQEEKKEESTEAATIK